MYKYFCPLKSKDYTNCRILFRFYAKIPTKNILTMFYHRYNFITIITIKIRRLD